MCGQVNDDNIMSRYAIYGAWVYHGRAINTAINAAMELIAGNQTVMLAFVLLLCLPGLVSKECC
jgi:hypothetical protein